LLVEVTHSQKASQLDCWARESVEAI